MLTGYQASTGAYRNEDLELYCPDCFDIDEALAEGGWAAVSNYELAGWQTANAEGWLDWDYRDETAEDADGAQYRLGPDDRWHVEACCCEPALGDVNDHELAEAYRDSACLDERPGEDEDE